MSEPIPQTDIATLGKRPLPHSRFFEMTFEMLMLAQAFLRCVLPKELLARLDIDALTIEPKQMFDVMFKETRADVIYRVPIKDSTEHIDFFIILEHKSFDDFWAIFQAFCYVVRICEREFKTANEEGRVDNSYRLPPVMAIIIHHGETRFTGSLEVNELFSDLLPEIREYLLNMKAILVDLSVMDESEIPSDPNVPELKWVLKMMKVIFSKKVGVKAKEIFEELKPYSEIPKYRYLIRLICVYLASSAKHLKNKYADLKQIIQTVAGEKEMSTLYELWTAEGEARGDAKAATVGQNAVLTVLRRRFKEIPKGIEVSVRKMSDPIALESLAGEAAVCQTLDEFAEALN
jgi:ribosomal silencing factor RsfS